jgi:cyanate permease
LAGLLIPRIGWRHTLDVCGLLQWGVALPLALVLVRRHPEDVGLVPDGVLTHAVPVTPPDTGVGLDRALRRLAFWTLALTLVGAQVGSNVLVAHQVAYMIDRGQDPAGAAFLAGLVGVASLPGRYVFNALSDRVPAQWLLGVAQLALACGVGLLGSARSAGGFLAYACVYGAAFGTTGGLAASVRADHFGRRAYGTISALQGYPGLVGAAVGPLLAGWLYDCSGSYALTWAGVAALYLASAVAMFATPKPPSMPGH